MPRPIPTDGKLSGPREYTTGTGQKVTAVHPRTKECDQYGCVIHNPSSHHLRHLKTHWRDDRKLMERICEHGVGHPDPDQMRYLERTLGEDRAGPEGIHGCDGCCSPSA